jgi:hypothetical protein
MKLRGWWTLAGALFPLVAVAWLPLSHRYPAATVTMQLGDLCDTARFPATPGSCAGDASNPDWRAEFQVAVGRWNDASTLFRFETDSGPAASVPGSCNSRDPNGVFFLPNACGTAWGSTTLAMARTFAYVASGEATHSDILFNSSMTWRAFDDGLSSHDGVDFRRVAVHEAGHVLGLGHPAHASSIMYYATQDVTAPRPDDLNGIKALYGSLVPHSTPDLDGNGVAEFVVVRSGNDGSTSAEIRDAASGTLLRVMTFLNGSFAPVGSAVLPDLDANGAPELAILAARRSDRRGVVEIRNLAGEELPRVIWFGAGLTPKRIAVVGDADANGVAELAVLATRVSDDRAVVEVKNGFGPAQASALWFMASASPLDLVSIGDSDGNSVAEVAVLLARHSDGRGVVEVKNAAGPTNPRQVWAMAGVRPRAIAAVADADANGVPEVVILSRRSSDGRIVAEVKNASGPTNPNALWFEDKPSDTHTALAVTGLPDADGNGVAELAVLTRRDSDGRHVVQVKNAAGPTAPRSLWLTPGFDPSARLISLDDTDGNAVGEVAVLLSRWSDGRLLIEQRNAGGPQAARQVWMSASP